MNGDDKFSWLAQYLDPFFDVFWQPSITKQSIDVGRTLQDVIYTHLTV